MPLRDLASPAPQTVCRPCNVATFASNSRRFNSSGGIEEKKKLTETKSTFVSEDVGMVNGSHRS